MVALDDETTRFTCKSREQVGSAGLVVDPTCPDSGFARQQVVLPRTNYLANIMHEPCHVAQAFPAQLTPEACGELSRAAEVVCKTVTLPRDVARVRPRFCHESS